MGEYAATKCHRGFHALLSSILPNVSCPAGQHNRKCGVNVLSVSGLSRDGVSALHYGSCKHRRQFRTSSNEPFQLLDLGEAKGGIHVREERVKRQVVRRPTQPGNISAIAPARYIRLA